MNIQLKWLGGHAVLWPSFQYCSLFYEGHDLTSEDTENLH